MVPDSTKSLWFAVYTAPRHEKSVSRHLQQRSIEHFLPLYKSRRKWKDGSKVELDLPLFPNYLFVRIDWKERVRVLEAPGVVSFVTGVGGKPATLHEEAIAHLQSGLTLRGAEPHALLFEGQKARICAGPLTGLEGVVLRHKNSLRVVLTIEQIMRSYSIEVASDELELISA